MFWQLWRAVLRLRKSMVSRCKRSFYCARFTLHGLLYTVYSEQFTLHVLLCKIYSAQFTPHDLLCSIYSAVWSDQWRVWHCLLETCLEVVWWLWSPHLPSPTFTSLLLNHAPLQTSLRASYTPHTNFLPARDPFPVVWLGLMLWPPSWIFPWPELRRSLLFFAGIFAYVLFGLCLGSGSWIFLWLN